MDGHVFFCSRLKSVNAAYQTHQPTAAPLYRLQDLIRHIVCMQQLVSQACYLCLTLLNVGNKEPAFLLTRFQFHGCINQVCPANTPGDRFRLYSLTAQEIIELF